jgi:hypothetical protein
VREHLVAGAMLIVAVGGLAGCGKFYWLKPGSTIDEFEGDNTACARQASANPTAASHGDVDTEKYRACLLGRGWTRQQYKSRPPDAFRGYEETMMKWN